MATRRHTQREREEGRRHGTPRHATRDDTPRSPRDRLASPRLAVPFARHRACSCSCSRLALSRLIRLAPPPAPPSVCSAILDECAVSMIHPATDRSDRHEHAPRPRSAPLRSAAPVPLAHRSSPLLSSPLRRRRRRDVCSCTGSARRTVDRTAQMVGWTARQDRAEQSRAEQSRAEQSRATRAAGATRCRLMAG